MEKKLTIDNNALKEKDFFTKKRILGICTALITLLIFFSSSILQIIPITLFNIDRENYTTTDLAIVNAFVDVMIVIILVLIYFKELKVEFKRFKNKWKEDMDIAFKYWFIGLIIMCVSNVIIGIVTNLNTSSNENAVQGLVTATPLLMLFTAGIIAPIIEEITFRKAIAKIFTNKWLYVIMSGLIFGYLHVFGSNNILEYLYIIPYGSLGFFFALTYYETKSIFPSIIMHAIHNSVLILLSIFV